LALPLFTKKLDVGQTWIYGVYYDGKTSMCFLTVIVNKVNLWMNFISTFKKTGRGMKDNGGAKKKVISYSYHPFNMGT
jgi:hypothetical protein